jgi:hypothetical protein
MIAVMAVLAAAALFGLPLGFLLGKRASLWCPGCGDTTHR